MPVGIYDRDPTAFVEMKIPVDDLRRLFDTLVDDEPPNEAEEVALARLKKFLDGEFKNGIGFEQLGQDAGNQSIEEG